LPGQQAEKCVKIQSIILRALSREPLSRSILGDRANLQGVSRATFDNAFSFLIHDGNVEKCGSEHLAPFRITEKGKKFLAWRGIV
jgi:predicted transcriptional regulator